MVTWLDIPVSHHHVGPHIPRLSRHGRGVVGARCPANSYCNSALECQSALGRTSGDADTTSCSTLIAIGPFGSVPICSPAITRLCALGARHRENTLRVSSYQPYPPPPPPSNTRGPFLKLILETEEAKQMIKRTRSCT